MENKTVKPKTKSKLYSFLRGVVTVLFNTFLPVKILGQENLSIDAPYIFIGNHKSWIDPVCMAYAVKKEQITFLAKKELFEVPVLGKLLHKINMISVDRNHSDMKAVRACLDALKNKRILGIFPEGTRHKKGTMEEMEGGIGLIALRSKAPVIPMYIPHPLRFFRKNTCYVGEAIQTEDLIEKGISNEVTQLLLERITQTYQVLEKRFIMDHEKNKRKSRNSFL